MPHPEAQAIRLASLISRIMENYLKAGIAMEDLEWFASLSTEEVAFIRKI